MGRTLNQVQLPNTSPEFWTLTHQEAYDPLKNQWSNVQPFVHIIKLDRIQSRIHKAVFRVDKDVLGGTPKNALNLIKRWLPSAKILMIGYKAFPVLPKTITRVLGCMIPRARILTHAIFMKCESEEIDFLQKLIMRQAVSQSHTVSLHCFPPRSRNVRCALCHLRPVCSLCL